MDVKTYNDLQTGLQRLIREKFGDKAWLEEVYVYRNELVYSENESGKHFQAQYEIDPGSRAFSIVGTPYEVVRETRYNPVKEAGDGTAA